MATIEFINRKRENSSIKAMRRVIKYILRENKTNEHLSHAILCDKSSAYEDFVQVKKLFGKETGRQYIHFIQSFSPDDDITPEIANEIAKRLITFPVFQDFQIVFATHTDKAHLHTHFVVNSVNAETGKKWQLSSNELQKLKDFSDELCREYGLSVIDNETKQKGHQSKGEYYRQKDGTSWKHELFLAVMTSLKFSVSREEFIQKMNDLNYQVIWENNRTYITFITPDGKRCRNRKLYPPERFTKENMETVFEKNKQFIDMREKWKADQKWFLLVDTANLLRGRAKTNIAMYPLSCLEGDALREYLLIHDNKGEIDWEYPFLEGEDFEV